MSKHRAQAFIELGDRLARLIQDLDNLQVGDYTGRVSPIKHMLKDCGALTALHDLAKDEYVDTQGTLSMTDEEYAG